MVFNIFLIIIGDKAGIVFFCLMVFNPDDSKQQQLLGCSKRKTPIDPLRTQFLVLLGIISLGFSCSLTPILYPSRSARWSQGRKSSGGCEIHWFSWIFWEHHRTSHGGFYSKPCSISRLYWNILKVDWGVGQHCFSFHNDWYIGMWWCTIVQNKLNCIQIWDLYTFL